MFCSQNDFLTIFKKDQIQGARHARQEKNFQKVPGALNLVFFLKI